MIIRKSNYSYIIRTESIIVVKNKNSNGLCVSFNSFHLQSKKKFHQFKGEIIKSKPSEYDNINDAYRLAREYNMRAYGYHKPSFINDKIAL